jgi:hypothetical protein
MASPIEKILKMSVVPPFIGGAFDEWLNQRDVLPFLIDDATSDRVIVYASLDHVFLKTIIVPNNKDQPLDIDELKDWSLADDTWGINYNYIEPAVWVEPPFNAERSEAFRGAEALVFSRHFSGRQVDKSYCELLQKFAHVFDLHYVQHKKAYCDLDENGDVRAVLQFNEIEQRPESPFGGMVAVVSRRFLEDYLLLSDTSAIRAFDFTRFSNNSFSGWSDKKVTKTEADSDFSYKFILEGGVGSYMRGVQVIRPKETVAQFHYRLTHSRELKQYASFIAYDWKNKTIKEISCAPEATANYFTESNLPFETTPAFFRSEVLRKYKSDPDKYTLNERSINCRSA